MSLRGLSVVCGVGIATRGNALGGNSVTAFNFLRTAFASVAAAATLFLGAGAATANPMQVTIDFGTGFGLSIDSPYQEDGFEIAGTNLFLSGIGNPARAISLDAATPSLTLTRTGGGAFSLIRFDYSCLSLCNFSVGGTTITDGSNVLESFTTLSPTSGFTDISSLLFSSSNSVHRIDNIVLSYDDIPPIPLPAGLPLLLGGLAGLGLMARRKRKMT